MPTTVVTLLKSVDRRFVSAVSVFLAGCLIGAVVGASKGSDIATTRFHNLFVPQDDYYRLCEENVRIANLYIAERVRNVQLTGKHEVARRVLKRVSNKIIQPVHSSKKPAAFAS
jgi:hypothetical protein